MRRLRALGERCRVVSALLDQPTLGAEIGTRAGMFTEHLLASHPTLTMYAVDSWCPQPPSHSVGAMTYRDYDWAAIQQEFHERTDRFGIRVILLNMDSVAAARRVPDGCLDFCFIDADHSYEGVARDIDAWWPKVRPGGIVCGHDYGHVRFPGVARAVDDRFVVQVLPDHVWWTRKD